MPAWPTLFESEGSPREVTANSPLLFHEPDSVWYVATGQVDVFAVSAQEGQPSGARIHLCRIAAGGLLIGHVAENEEGSQKQHLLGVGLPGSKVLHLHRSRLVEMAADPELAESLAGPVDVWVEAMTAAIARGRLPKSLHLLEPGGTATFSNTENITPVQGTLWVRHSEGSSHLLGSREAPVSPTSDLVPLSARGWMETQPGAVVSAEKTASVLKEGECWAALDRFHDLVLRCVGVNARDATSAECARLQRKAALEGQLIEGTLAQLAAVARREEETEAPVLAVGQDNPLLAACNILGATQGLTFRMPRSPSEKKWSDPISAIARASHVRVRRVLLAGKWWTQDNGPLLGFTTEGDQPFALLPTSSSSYEMVNPMDRTRTPVTAENAGLLTSFGYSFYRPFEARGLNPVDILRFGLAGARKDIVLILLLGLAGGLVNLLTPIAIGLIFDRIIPGGEHSQLLLIVLALTVAALSAALFQLTQGIAMLRVETRMEGSVESGLWDRLLNLPTPFFRDYTAGDLANRAGGITAIRKVLTDVAMSSLLTVTFSLVSFVLLFYYSAWLAMLAVALFVLVVVVTGWIGLRQLEYERRDHQIQGKISGLVLQLVTGITRLRVAGAENRALAVWAKEFSQQRKLAFRARDLSNLLAAFNAALPIFASLLLFGMVAYSYRQNLSLGIFLAFLAAFTQVLFAGVTLSTSVTSVLEIVPLYERAKPILESVPEIVRNKNDPGDISGEIEVSHLSYRYSPDGPLVLDDVSVHIRPGEFVAFVGPSGAGKSTLFRLLLGFETPTSGSIYYDREELAGLDLQSIRRQIGVVLQHSKLMPGDIFSNIVGSTLLTREDAWTAARMSGLADDIKKMPMGMYTVVSEGESTLSGGQRQRLMIARAIASRPRVLFFDEATSALDNATQAIVSRSLSGLKATRVVVAHRLSTIMHADCIHVMDRGKIVQSGSYEELVKQGGLFADLVRRQLL